MPGQHDVTATLFDLNGHSGEGSKEPQLHNFLLIPWIFHLPFSLSEGSELCFAISFQTGQVPSRGKYPRVGAINN